MKIYTLFSMQLGRPATVPGSQIVGAVAGTNNLIPVSSTQDIPPATSLSSYFLDPSDTPFIRRFRFDSVWKSQGAFLRWEPAGNYCSIFARNASRSPRRLYDTFQPFALGEWVDVNQLVKNPWTNDALEATKALGFTATISTPTFDSTKVPASFAGNEIQLYFEIEIAHTLDLVIP